MAAIEFRVVGGEYKARSPIVNNQEMVNLYPIVDQDDSPNPMALYPCPGLVTWARVPTGAYEIRAMEVIADDTLLVVAGNTLYLIDQDKIMTQVTGTLDSVTGPVIVTSNWADDPVVDTYVVLLDVVEHKLYYILRGTTTLVEQALPVGVVPTSLAYQDGYWLVSHQDSDNYYSSEAYDPTSWNATWYKSAEYKGDKLVRLFSSAAVLVMLGSRTIEYHANLGTGDLPVFFRQDGVGIDMGLSAVDAVTLSPQGVFWLDETGVPRYGAKGENLPHTQVSYQMDNFATINDCFAFSYTQDSHTFIVYTFPTEDKTYVYDVTTGHWHRRSSGDTDSRWRANCYAKFVNKHLVGDSQQTGKIFELSNTTFTEDGDTMIALRSCPAFSNKREYIRHNSLELRVEAGEGLVTGQGSDPQVMMTYSDDNGRTWSNELFASIGKMGEYRHRTTWTRLGRSMERIYRFKISDPVPRIISGGYLNGRFR